MGQHPDGDRGGTRPSGVSRRARILSPTLRAVRGRLRWLSPGRSPRPRAIRHLTVEEHPGVSRAVARQSQIGHELETSRRLEQAEDIVVVAGHSVSAVPEGPSPFEPAPGSMQDDDLVPECPLGLHGCDAVDTEGQVGDVLDHVRCHGRRDIRVEGGLRASFDLHGGAHVVGRLGNRGIPEEQRLSVRILRVQFESASSSTQSTGERLCDGREPLAGQPRDERPAGVSDCVKARPTLLSTQCLQLINRGAMTQVRAKHRHVDVFGETRNESERLRQRCSALEQETRPGVAQSVEQRVEHPADPEVLLNVLDGSAHPGRGRQEEIEALISARGRSLDFLLLGCDAWSVQNVGPVQSSQPHPCQYRVLLAEAFVRLAASRRGASEDPLAGLRRR